ncbi:MAG: zinc ribbon domain-containing protein [Kiritimatiellae bacterium]|nr:zinc ribbon domain-containing protein [Kiritimatiellia bacterium]NLD89431.1 zinc ribbon domain-containing protein [Lentisphaerota bacterium]HPC20108.1 zinc ribbon domain-containing protein [Kiritimatiellia bacterium]HQQ61282.1 zinc ribbon domain-containing protein [Kiritimatiellia bacterium]
MPLFEYICQSCGARSEQLVSAARIPACPQCGSTRLEKQLSGFNTRGSTTPDAMPPCSTGACPVPRGGCAGGSCPCRP